MKRAKDEQIKSCFSKYVKTAIKRARRDCLLKKYKTDSVEYLVGSEVISNCNDGVESEWMLLEEIENVSWEAEPIRAYLENCVGEKLNDRLNCLTDYEIIVLFARVLCQYPFLVIGQKLGQRREKVASAYYYALKKIKKGWDDEF